MISLFDTTLQYRLQFPVISRRLWNYRTTPPGPLMIFRKYDFVYWGVSGDNVAPERNYLMNISIWNCDTNNVAIQWSANNRKYVKSYYKLIGLPDIIHGDSYIGDPDIYLYGTESVLNFRY